jgi:hypothetical protein
MRHAAELEFLGLIEGSPICRDKCISACPGEKFGVSVACSGVQLGLWSWVDGALRFRTLASWEPLITAVDADAAVAATVKMATSRD